jgi:LacI family transcriptional regulator
MDKEIASLQKPVVLMDRYFPDVPDFNHVVVDNFQGAYTAVSHMVDRGYKKIAIITTTSTQIQMQLRMDGFVQALKEHNLPAGKNMIKRLAFDLDRPGFILEITKYLQHNTDLDAIFFATNYLGICGIESIRGLQLQIGKDLGMVSFDDHDIFRLHSPSITCVAQPVEEIGRRLIQLLIEELDNNLVTTSKVVLPLELRERESTMMRKK